MCTAWLILFAALDLGTLFLNKDAWTGKAEFFAVEHAKDGFAFASENRTIVNCLKHDTCTWHELKRMPEDWAFAITHDAFFLKSR